MKVLSWKRSEATRLGPVDPDAGYLGPVFEARPQRNRRAARGLLFVSAMCLIFVVIAAGLALAKFF